MRKYLLAALLSLATAPIWAGTISIGGSWLGLKNSGASVNAQDNEARDLNNVDLCDDGGCIKKRAGYSQFRTVGVSTWAVRGGYYWRDAGGNDNLTVANDQKVYKSVNSGAFSAFITTDTAGSYYDFTDSNGWLYRTNSSHDQFCRYNGTTLVYSTTAPRGSICEMLSDRMLISGNTTYVNRIYYSKRADPMEFTTGITDDDSFYYDHGAPGAGVTAVKAWNDGVLVWTKNTMSYVVYDSQSDLTPVQKISGTIGTLQPGTVIDDFGVVYFQAQDNHWYSFDGNGLAQISKPIDVSGIVSGESKNWPTSTQAEFGAGTFVNTSSITSPGDVVLSDIPNGTYNTTFDGATTPDAATPVWTLAGVPSTATSSGGIFTYGGASNYGRLSATDWGTARTTAPYVIEARLKITKDGSSANGFSIQFNDEIYGNSIRFNDSYWDVGTLGSNIVGLYTPAGGLITSYSMASDGGYHTYLIYRESTTVKVYVDGALRINTTRTDATTDSKALRFGMFTNGAVAAIDYVRYIPQYTTGTYQSPVGTVGTAITAWGPFESNNVLNGGTISYGLYGCSATVTGCSLTNYVSSQTITSGAIPVIGTMTYILWYPYFTRLSGQNPTLNGVTVNWYEGTVTTHFGTVDKDHRLIWAVAEGTATVPSVSYLYDQRFSTWLKYDFPMAAPARVGDSVYFGGVSTGVVYMWPSGNTDNGAAITAYWKSKDFIGDNPYVEKQFANYSILAKSQTGSNLDFTYTINTSSDIARNFSLTDSGGNTFKRINDNFPSGKFGTFFSMKFGNDDGDSPFEIYAVGINYTDKPWRVSP